MLISWAIILIANALRCVFSCSRNFHSDPSFSAMTVIYYVSKLVYFPSWKFITEVWGCFTHTMST